MTFGYTLLGALLLLLPGFAGYYGYRVGEASDFVSPRPDRPNSTQTIFLIVLLALVGHVVGAGLFAVNETLASWKTLVPLPYDPNPYKALINGRPPTGLSSLAIELELSFFLALAGAMFWLCEKIARAKLIASRTDPIRFGWLAPIVQKAGIGDHVAVGYVRTTSEHDGAWIAYEGSVRRLTLDDDDGIKMIVLEQCDRFLVRIKDDRMERVDVESSPIAMMHIASEQIADFAIEIFEVPAPANETNTPAANALEGEG